MSGANVSRLMDSFPRLGIYRLFCIIKKLSVMGLLTFKKEDKVHIAVCVFVVHVRS